MSVKNVQRFDFWWGNVIIYNQLERFKGPAISDCHRKVHKIIVLAHKQAEYEIQWIFDNST